MKQAPFKIFSTTIHSPLPHFTGTKNEVYVWLSENMYGPDGFEVYDTENDTAQDARGFLEDNNPFVPKFYRMNPKTDDLIPNGKYLMNGMRVLVDSSKQRMNRDSELSDWQEDRALEVNRWCTVGALEMIGDSVRFIGVYDDGSKRMRSYTVDQAWLVKIDSVRESANIHTEKFSKVRRLVSDAVMFGAEEEISIRTVGGSSEELNRGIDELTKKLLGLL